MQLLLAKTSEVRGHFKYKWEKHREDNKTAITLFRAPTTRSYVTQALKNVMAITFYLFFNLITFYKACPGTFTSRTMKETYFSRYSHNVQLKTLDVADEEIYIDVLRS